MSYADAYAALPQPLRASRAKAFERFAQEGFPGKRLEEWRYTDLTALAGQDFSLAEGHDAAAPQALEQAESLRFVNGRRLGAPVREDQAQLVDDGVTALNAALYRDGLDLQVGKNGPTRFHVHAWSGAQTQAAMSHLRHRIVVERGCEALLFLDLGSDDGELLTTTVSEIEVQAGARLSLVRLQALGRGTTDISRTEVRLARDARLDYVGLDLGGAVSRHDLNVQLLEPGAEAQLHGVFAPGGKSHADTHTRIIHAAPHTTSRELYRGLVLDRAKAVFNGKIVVQPGAQKTDSEQHLGTLLLSPAAEINAKPELEIYADDVKCAHGNTCGQLDDNAIYYLRTRGLDLDAARNLLTYTFAHDALQALKDDALRKRLGQALLSQLPNGADLEELL